MSASDNDSPDVPVSVFLRMVLACLNEQRARQETRLTSNPRAQEAKHDKSEARTRAVAAIRRHIEGIAALMRPGVVKGTVRADVAALVCAVTLGHSEAMRQLEDLLTLMENPAASVVIELSAQDISGMVTAIVGKRVIGSATHDENPDEV